MIAAGALLLSSAWWVVIVQLWPATARPYISNSADNSVLDLAFGYNGMDRIVGSSDGGHGGGLRRLFVSEMGNEISWLVPVALVGLCFGAYLWQRGLLSRSERTALVMWGGWFLLCGMVFSYMDGMAHPYYTSAMAPAVGALAGLGGVWAAQRSSAWDGRVTLGALVALASAWSVQLLRHNQFGPSWTRGIIAIAATVAVVVIVLMAPSRRGLASVATTIGVLAGFGGTAAFAVATAATPHAGSIPNAVHTATLWPTVRGRFDPTGVLQAGSLQYNTALAAALRTTRTKWAAATSGSQAASALEIASGTAVMAIGGWSHDPVPTLSGFIDAVHHGQVAYYVDSGRAHGKSRYGHDILDWVIRNYPATNIGGAKVYRLA